jgi:hypothetical protein
MSCALNAQISMRLPKPELLAPENVYVRHATQDLRTMPGGRFIAAPVPVIGNRQVSMAR